MKNKARTICVVLLIFIALGTVALAGTETQLTQDERLTQRTAIYGNYVFWIESAGNDVHAYDLTTGNRADITGNSAGGKINAYGDKVVWTGDGESVYMYNISTGNKTMIADGRRVADIYGNYIVYTNNYYYNQDQENDGIYLYDLETQNETKIAAVYSFPAIYGNRVVWSQENNSSAYDIYLYNLSTQETGKIATTNRSEPESELEIFGNVVVWTESDNVYMHDIAANKTTPVTSNGNSYQPAIYGNRIVYTIGNPYIGGNKDIYMYEIPAARTTRITNSTFAFNPSVYGDKIVYADCRNNPEFCEARDIYLYDLSNTSNSLVANFTDNVSKGTAPLNVSFSDTSTGTPDTWYWDFGDGEISNEQNPVHTYVSAGNYTACLTVNNANGTDSKLVTISVK
ncbi:cell surface protein [Methanosarcina siciliae T4/M]|uniref:Cell surface protein n=1 Tax=Methanosarcina siciliae T4/M TaxID=1434120 RepID=A0A0E3P415_9EURY|nr:PKD domain-containing protein [Methanosarcina siciliae]AKB28205.1 cell surface protein [Methanosarcina siciliae T4/M]